MGSYTVQLDPLGDGVVSASPHWLLCVVRFKHPNTFSRATNSSADSDPTSGAAERPKLVITTARDLVVSGEKRSHVKSLSSTLHPVTNYVEAILPGDWVLAWVVNDRDKYLDLLQRVRAEEPCNGFYDGLKFLGRVKSLRKSLAQFADGKRRVSYKLQATGFSEFDSSVFWDPYLAAAETSIGTWLGKLGVAVSDFLSQDGIDVNTAIPQLLEVLLGSGISQSAANPDGAPQLQAVTGSTTGSGEAPFAYVVPATVGKLLGVQGRSKPGGLLAYADLLTLLSGVQKYAGAGATPWLTFQPTSVSPMLGKFLPAIPQFSGKSFWSALDQYVNPAVNEMYTCLRAEGTSGAVVPTLVVRQLPFTSELKKSDDRTAYLELPRWVVPTAAIQEVDVGTSDALRFNFVHLMGQSTAQAEPNNFTAQLVWNPPVRDDADIQRSGLRPDMQVVACGIEDQKVGPKAWMDLRTDFLMGQHLHLSGSLTSYLIQEPICEGDNLEYGGTVFHIEGVTHTCAISPDGKKHASTTLSLSTGMAANPDASTDNAVADDALYSSLDPEGLTQDDPGLTFDGGDQ